jgi:hypothetical protein
MQCTPETWAMWLIIPIAVLAVAGFTILKLKKPGDE